MARVALSTSSAAVEQLGVGLAVRWLGGLVHDFNVCAVENMGALHDYLIGKTGLFFSITRTDEFELICGYLALELGDFYLYLNSNEIESFYVE